MPRPARSHLRKSRPISKRHDAPPPSGPIKKQLAQQLSSKRLAQPLHDSDDSDKLVIKGPGGRTGGYLAKNEIYASGGVGNGDQPGSHPTRAQRRKQMIQAAPGRQRTASVASGSPKSTQGIHSPETESRTAGPTPNTNAPSTIVRHTSAQPTPSRDNSILDGIRPRRRQHSILRAPEVEDSSLGPTDDSFALPDDESTPLNGANAKLPVNTPDSSRPTSSASKKRKLGSLGPLGSLQDAEPTAFSILTTEPALPPQPPSTLRASGQRQRLKAADQEDSIMAPPMSSSSTNSPTKPESSSSSRPRKAAQRPPTLLTEQLQALMPSKRRKAARMRTAARPEFDILEDTDAPVHHIKESDQDSSFLPTRRKPRMSRLREKNKTHIDSRTGVTKSKLKKSKGKPAKTKQPSTSTRLTLPRSAGNQGTKFPSQHFTTARTCSPSSAPNANGGKVVGVSSQGRWSGGSLLKVSVADMEEKENLAGGPGETTAILVARSDDEIDQVDKARPPSPRKARSKWEEIDAWDMEFEEVEVWERSSEKDAR